MAGRAVRDYLGATRLAWFRRLGTGVADQAVLSGSSFAASLLLARWLSPTAYGVWAIVFSFYLLLFVLHVAFFQEPATVLGAALSSSGFRGLMGRLQGLQTRVLIGTSALLALIALGVSFTEPDYAYVVFSLALALPFLLNFHLLRRSEYVAESHRQTRASAVFGAVYVALLGVLASTGTLSAASAFIAMGAGAFFGSLLLRRPGDRAEADTQPIMTPVANEVWNYGKWVALSFIVAWLSSTVYQPIVGRELGLEQAGAYRAMANLVMPLAQLMTAVGLVMLPHFARQHELHGLGDSGRRLLRLVGVNTAVALVYLAVLAFTGERLIVFLYGDYTVCRVRAARPPPGNHTTPRLCSSGLLCLLQGGSNPALCSCRSDRGRSDYSYGRDMVRSDYRDRWGRAWPGCEHRS